MRQKDRAGFRMGAGRRSLAVVMAIFFFSAAVAAAQTAVRQKITFVRAGVTVLAEYAGTPAERSRGLMLRTSMGETEAMLFSFEELERQTFWMYRTRIPLTVIFVDERLRIVDMQDMAPCPSEDPDACPLCTSRRSARHAIEVNQGFAAKYGIKVGDRIVIEKTGR